MLTYKLPNANATVLTIADTAISISDAITAAASEDYIVPSEVDAIDLFIEAESIRWLDDGNTPTATKGHLAIATSGDLNQVIRLRGSQVNKLKMIRATGTSATVSVRLGKILVG